MESTAECEDVSRQQTGFQVLLILSEKPKDAWNLQFRH